MESSSVPVTATVSLAVATSATTTSLGAAAPDMLTVMQEKPVSANMIDPGKKKWNTFGLLKLP